MKSKTKCARHSRLILVAAATVFLCILSWSAVASAGWVRRYKGPASSEGAYGIAVDSSDNVYVTGMSYGDTSDWDFATIKYDTNGNRKWVRRYNGPENLQDWAMAVAVDSSGNVYVTGYSGSSTSGDFATIKYDSNGNRKWVRRYNGPGNINDYPVAIAVGSIGNVYVTGHSYSNTSYEDFTTIKYDTNGNRKWVRRYNGPGKQQDIAYAIAVDSNGNVYVTGSMTDESLRIGFATIRYDSNGNQKWVKKYNSPGDSGAVAYAIAVDSRGNVYVTGESTGTDSEGDLTTIKYDTNGNQKWVKRYNGPGNNYDVAYAIAVDSRGNVYVTGESAGRDSQGDLITIKYDTNGNQRWVKRYNGPGNSYDIGNSITVGTSGNVYVTGVSPDSSQYNDFVTIKYDAETAASTMPSQGEE